MKENFTATQKEVVARKMGYNGPMHMFDEFLMSTPAEAKKYSLISSKVTEKMAKGGDVTGYAKGGQVVANKMKASQIITEHAKTYGLDPRLELSAIQQLGELGDLALLQENNTVVILRKLQPYIVEFYSYSSDSPEKLAVSILSLMNKIRDGEVKAMYGFFKEGGSSVVTLLKKIGVDVTASDVPLYDWKALV
jgi:hypothetical protein